MNSNYAYGRPEEDEEDRQAYDDYFNDAAAAKDINAMEDIYNENLGEDFEVRL